MMDNVHATAQAVWDVRRLLSWIRTQEPADADRLEQRFTRRLRRVGSSRALDDGLTCAILGVPVADLIELLGRHAGFSADDPRRQMVAVAEPIGRMVSPLSLTPRVPMSGRFIYAGDRRPARPPARAGRPPVGTPGQTRDRLVPRRPHRVLPVAARAPIRRRRRWCSRGCIDGPPTMREL